jgi:hypothetical protein
MDYVHGSVLIQLSADSALHLDLGEVIFKPPSEPKFAFSF